MPLLTPPWARDRPLLPDPCISKSRGMNASEAYPPDGRFRGQSPCLRDSDPQNMQYSGFSKGPPYSDTLQDREPPAINRSKIPASVGQFELWRLPRPVGLVAGVAQAPNDLGHQIKNSPRTPVYSPAKGICHRSRGLFRSHHAHRLRGASRSWLQIFIPMSSDITLFS